MKKHYGPIVLGIIALTLAAPVSNATTVLAEEVIGSEGTTEGNQSQDSQEETDQPTDEEIISTLKSNLEENLEKLKEKSSSNSLVAAQKTTLSDAYKDISAKAEKDSTIDGLGSLIDQTNKYIAEDAKIPYTYATPKDVTINGKADTLASRKILFADPKTAKLTISDDDAEYLSFSNKEGKTTDTIPLSLDENGELSIDSDYLDANGKLNLASSLTTEDLNNTIQNLKDRFATFNDDDKAALDNFYDTLTKNLDGLTEDSTYTDLLTAKNNLSNEISKSTTVIHYGADRMILNVPLLKNHSIAIRTTGSSFLNVTFNKDATKVAAAQVVDEKGNPVKVDSKYQVGLGTLDNQTQTDPVTLNNEVKTKTNHNSSSSKTEKPATKPTHIKSISNHQTTFYALPNTIATLFDENGNELKNRALGGDSSWYADKLMNLDGVNYLRVATNEWTKLADGLEVTPLDQNVFTKNDARLYQANGQKVTNRALAKNTAWRTDKSATINGQTMYRVATNEWVSANDLI
ncbi:SLAP domain-containing protein [Companilactobacillus formosensis]|uniref:SLAP domain-containing protein n=1 Tax=Companilactobacillus formosensis TaxID=1617889 RepID=UPI001FE64117|nr:SLAP domain-containing protein [Companilactobacillus formosensis]